MKDMFEQLNLIELLTNELKRAISFDVCVEFLQYSVNLSYKVRLGNKNLFCRVYRPGKETRESILAEHDFLNYLISSEVKVASPVAFSDLTTLKTFKHKGKEYFYSLFDFVEGEHIVKDKWDNEFVSEWGKTLGKIHKASKKYNTNTFHRLSWNESQWANPTSLIQYNKLNQDEISILKTEHEKIMKFFSTLPTDNEYFGLVHYDLHPGNLLKNKDGLFVIDFDDMCRHWYIWDFAMPLHRLGGGHLSNNNQKLKEIFIKSYKLETELPELMENNLKTFERIRHLFMLSWLSLRKDEEKWKNIFPRYLKHHIGYIKDNPIRPFICMK